VSISTHVLDAVTGRPAVGMTLRLERASGEPVVGGTTDEDGRCAALGDRARLDAGRYRMVFDTGAWFARSGTSTFYPVVELVFEVNDPAAHYHVPLLLSPFAFSTYRGS
jgi:5-hydroxyisourate hydrolase